MRIEKLTESTKKNLLEDLLKRSPNNYGQYEASVKEILDKVNEACVLACEIMKKHLKENDANAN